MLENPCKKNCPDRTGTCHADCPRWAAYEILRDIMYEQSWAEKQKQEDIYHTYHASKKKKRRRPYADSRGGY